jgi:hypothetical protein
MFAASGIWKAGVHCGRREMLPITSIERNDFCHTWAANIFTSLFSDSSKTFG